MAELVSLRVHEPFGQVIQNSHKHGCRVYLRLPTYELVELAAQLPLEGQHLIITRIHLGRRR
ncbi:hypothetical protein D7044_29310 [Micromonospora musae]|uniref:Uncharacterized protein n=1 Tax=Micromonospora musae TaxID=1894970 RepID=A0A3A9XP48_9ACTN|nr:hypothetical protein D7044_29310 [Micromonospora musae]